MGPFQFLIVPWAPLRRTTKPHPITRPKKPLPWQADLPYWQYSLDGILAVIMERGQFLDAQKKSLARSRSSLTAPGARKPLIVQLCKADPDASGADRRDGRRGKRPWSPVTGFPKASGLWWGQGATPLACGSAVGPARPPSILRLVHQAAFGDPGHHFAQAGADGF